LYHSGAFLGKKIALSPGGGTAIYAVTTGCIRTWATAGCITIISAKLLKKILLEN
jgi:hypothetical protein